MSGPVFFGQPAVPESYRSDPNPCARRMRGVAYVVLGVALAVMGGFFASMGIVPVTVIVSVCSAAALSAAFYEFSPDIQRIFNAIKGV